MSGALAFLSGFTPKFWLAICAALLAALPVAYFIGRDAGADAVEARYASAREEELQQAREADAAASEQRADDTKTLTRKDEERHEAIDDAQPGVPDAANRALGCQRLRQAGVAPLPAGC